MKIPPGGQIGYVLLGFSVLVRYLVPAGIPVPAQTLGANGKIAYDSYRSGNYEIFVMDASGANPTRLTENTFDDYSPAWSPDGTRIAFTSYQDFNTEVYVMDANGSNPTNLTNNVAVDKSPAWSRDGMTIAFTSDRDGYNQIYVMNADGSNQTRVTNTAASDSDPAWSPDGMKIAFTRTPVFEQKDVYVMDADGSNPINLTKNPGVNSGPAWSPDGRRIAFVRRSDLNASGDIYIMDADGSNQNNLTNEASDDDSPTWSPDGTKIAFQRRAIDGNFRVYVMDSNGANQIVVKDIPGSTDPDWQWRFLPPQALNISTRLRVDTGNNVLIGGFIITGSAPKSVALRGIGPSLAAFGVPDALSDPTLELHDSSGTLLSQNDNWEDDPSQAAQLTALGLGPDDPNESGIIASLQPNAYTAILAGKNGGTGVGLVEVYVTNQEASSQLANISTRGFVLTGSNVMIGGFILGGNSSTHVVVRGIGPSLTQVGVPDPLADPTLELHDANGALLLSNDNWQDDSTSAAQISSLGLAPQNSLESGIYSSLPPGAFTAILAGNDGGTGVGLIEIYNVH